MPYRVAVVLVLMGLLVLPPEVGAQRADVRVGSTRVTVEGQYVPGQVLVRFKPGVNATQREQALARVGGREVKKGLRSGLDQIALRDGLAVAEAVQTLRQDNAVATVAANAVMRAFDTPNDPYFSLQWHLKGPAQGGMNAQQAWDLAPSPGSGIVVAVLDTGVAFETATRASYQFGFFGTCTARGDLSYMKAPDLAGTTFVPGRDFVCTPAGGDDSPNDDNAHGTHVAGTIAQTTNNGTGVAGVARNASIMPVKVLDTGGSGNVGDLVEGIYWAVDHGARVINMSLGFDPSLTLASLPGLSDALDYAYAHGVTVVAAAGNNGATTVSYPAAYRTVIAVGATRLDKTRASYSNYGGAPDAGNNDGAGRAVDVMAPGGDTTVDQDGDGFTDGVLQNTFDPQTKNPLDFAYWFLAGTSMATPHVSGAAAVLLGRNPSWGPDQVRNALQSTAIDLGPPGADPEYGYGLVNLYAALGGVAGSPTPTGSVSMTPTPGGPPATSTPTAGGPTATHTPTPVPNQVAFDGFESGNGSGGTGWSGPWTLTGGTHTRVLNAEGPQTGSWHLRLVANDAAAQRSVVVPSGGPYLLSFGSKVSSFEGNDEAYVVVNGVRQRTFSSADSDGLYHTYQIGLSPGTTTILFDAQMSSATNDLWYIDNVEVKVGTAASPTATPTVPSATPTATVPSATPTRTFTSTASPIATATRTPTFTSTPTTTPYPGVTLVASPTSVISGASIPTNWYGIPTPSVSDWIGLYAPGAPDGNSILYRFTGGSTTGSMPFPIPPYVAPGTYELRLFSNNTMNRLAVSNSFVVTACPTANLSSAPTSVPAGWTVTATWSGVCFPTSSDYLALHSVGAADGTGWAWIWSGGTASGSAPFTIPGNVPPGSYELRMYANNTNNRLAVGNTFSVTAAQPTLTRTATLSPSPTATATVPTATPTVPTATPTTPPSATPTAPPSATPLPSATLTATGTLAPSATETATDVVPPSSTPTGVVPPSATPTDVALTATPTTTSSPTATLPPTETATPVPPSPTPTSSPTVPPTPSPTSGVTLVASPTSVVFGGSIPVSWSGIQSPSPSDWVGLYRPGAGDGSPNVYRFTGGGTSGTMQFQVPQYVAPGTYEFRLFANNTYTRLAVSNLISVTGCPTAVLSSAPTSTVAGGTITATWSGVCYPTPTDWIALHSAGAPDSSYWAWIWSGGAASGSAPFTIPANVPPGTYEVRMYAYNSSNRLAAGNPFTVVTP